jgi:hypothetical protein
LVLLLSLTSVAAQAATTKVESQVGLPDPAVEPDTSANPSATVANIRIEEPALHSTSSYDQLVSFQFGQYHPQSTQISNGTYNFDYGTGHTFTGELGWALKLMEPGAHFGAFYLEEGLAFSSFSGNIQTNPSVQLSANSYSLYLFGLDSRVMYAAEWFPWKSLVPFADGGYQYTFYYQPGSSGLESVNGGVGNFVAGGGARLWLNRDGSIRGAMPIFITAKVNRIFPQANTLNLASTSFLGGLTLGL